MEAIATDKPDIILLDMQLPGMDGLTLVRQLKAHSATRLIPIVAVTVYPIATPARRLRQECVRASPTHRYPRIVESVEEPTQNQ